MYIKEKTPIWKNKKVVPVFLQIVFMLMISIMGIFLIRNAIQGLENIGIKIGFDFLSSTASFSIHDKLINYSPTDSYGRALLVGLLNSIKVGAIGIIFSAVIGLFIGIGRLSDNWLVKKLTGGYVELIRNTPLLIQIFFLYFAVFLPFPKIEESINLLGIFYFSNRGNAIPWFVPNPSWGIWLIFLVIGLVSSIVLWKRMIKKQVESGQRKYPLAWSAGAAVIAILLAYFITLELPVGVSIPRIKGVLFEGGYVISSEFAAILLGLIIYHSAFIAEVVRSGIMAVPKGQVEAAKALGLRNGKIMRFIILPQACRIIIPSATSQFLNLFKNSTLAVAVGYTDLFSIGNTIINQTGRAIEIMVLMASVYLIVSLVISLFMNWFNRYYQLIER